MTRPLLSILIPTWNQEVLAIRALDSIPRRDDIEVIVSDDASTDNTWENILRYREEHPELNLKCYRNEKNLGCWPNGNLIGTYATGEYTHGLDNDDYLITDEYNRVIDMINGEDAIYMNLRINSGEILVLNEANRHTYCAPITRIVRRDFAKNLRFHTDRGGLLDAAFNEEFLAMNPVCKYTGIIAYHHNFPREGSVTDMFRRGYEVR